MDRQFRSTFPSRTRDATLEWAVARRGDHYAYLGRAVGDRYGLLRDPFGHRWAVATRVREVRPLGASRACLTANQRSQYLPPFWRLLSNSN